MNVLDTVKRCNEHIYDKNNGKLPIKHCDKLFCKIENVKKS